jgi:hypothetical protein
MNDVSVLVRRANPVPTADHLPEAEFAAARAVIEEAFAGRQRSGRVRHVLQRLGRRPAMLFAGAMAVAVLLVGSPLLFVLATGDGGVAASTAPTTPLTTAVPLGTTTPPTTTAASTSTTLPAEVMPSAPAIAWSKVPAQPAFGDVVNDQWVASFTRGGPGLVGIGYVFAETDYRPRGVVFVSADGEVWERIDLSLEDGSNTWAEEGPADIAAGPGGRLVIVGGDGEDAAVWVSDDGYSWSRTAVGGLTAPGHQMMLAVAATGDGFIAVGDGGDDSAGVWVSTDGLEWNRVEDEDLLPSDDGPPRLNDVIVGGPGLVALGAQAMVSADGVDWQPLAVDSFAGEPANCAMSATAHPDTGRLTVFGCTGLWTSDDGYEWTLTAGDLPLGGPAAGADVAWDGDVGVAVGRSQWHSLWVTGDGGATWSRVEPVEPVFSDFFDQVVSVTWFEGRWIVVGQDIDGGAVWIGTQEQ